jgi:SAM-dependent methyltransferase
MKTCPICGNPEALEEHRIREMMFGTREEFLYLGCPVCDSLAIAEAPSDLSKYYSGDYYSFAGDLSVRGRLRRFAHRERARHAALRQWRPLGALMHRRYPDPMMESLAWLPLRREMTLLDVGCGSGKLIFTLGSLGFARALGIDPFIDADRRFDNGVELRRTTLDTLEESFDVIMFHHSFEHMSDPARVLAETARLLTAGGVCVINTPNLRSAAWEEYGTDWVQLDAPRHLFIHSARSLAVLAEKAALRLTAVRYNSTAFQFWGSEQYRRGIPLNDAASHAVNTAGSPFTAAEIRKWDANARKLNDECRGDQMALYLRHRPEHSDSAL